MKSFLVILTATIVFGSIIILLIEGKAVYNEFLAYSFFKQLKNKKFKKAFNTIHLIVGRRIRAYLTIELVKNPDILKTMGERKSKQFLVGFALETQNEEENAKGKLVK